MPHSWGCPHQGVWLERGVMHKLAEIHLLDIAQLVWDGSDCLVEMMRGWSFTLTPRACALLRWWEGGVLHWLQGLVPCWDDERVEFYIDSKGPVPCWDDDSGVLYWLQGACALLRWWQWSFILTPRGLCLVEMMTVEFYIDSKGPVPCWDDDSGVLHWLQGPPAQGEPFSLPQLFLLLTWEKTRTAF